MTRVFILSLLSSNLNDRLSGNFHRFVRAYCMHVEILPSEKTGLWHYQKCPGSNLITLVSNSQLCLFALTLVRGGVFSTHSAFFSYLNFFNSAFLYRLGGLSFSDLCPEEGCPNHLFTSFLVILILCQKSESRIKESLAKWFYHRIRTDAVVSACDNGVCSLATYVITPMRSHEPALLRSVSKLVLCCLRLGLI